MLLNIHKRLTLGHKLLICGCIVVILAIVIFRPSDSGFLPRDKKAEEDRLSINRSPSRSSGFDPKIRENKYSPAEKSAGNSLDSRPATGKCVQKIVELRKSGITRPVFQLLDQEGNLTSPAIKAASLTSNQAVNVQMATDKLMQELSLQIKNHTKEDERLSKNGETVYRIEPFADEGGASVEDYLDFLSSEVGKDNAWLLAKAIPMEEIAGGMGSYEVIFRLKEPAPDVVRDLTPEQSKEFYSVIFEYRDSTTGARIINGMSDWNSFNRKFFGILE